jgi:hypothetical protein
MNPHDIHSISIPFIKTASIVVQGPRVLEESWTFDPDTGEPETAHPDLLCMMGAMLKDLSE